MTIGSKKIVVIVATIVSIGIVMMLTTFPSIIVVAQKNNNQMSIQNSSAMSLQDKKLIYITKENTNSYFISNAAFSTIGSFDTTYRITGRNSDLKDAENITISTIRSDFDKSPTLGYIRVSGSDNHTSPTSRSSVMLPNPFADENLINQRITTELHKTISQSKNNTPSQTEVEIICNFGMSLDDMNCEYIPVL
jgi:hypothetical protein